MLSGIFLLSIPSGKLQSVEKVAKFIKSLYLANRFETAKQKKHYINTLTAMSTKIVYMAVFNEALSTIFVDDYLSVSSAGNNCCIRPMLFLWH